MDTANNNVQQQPSWVRSQIDDFMQRTVGKEDIRTPEDAVRYACSAAHVIAWDLHARIQELERELAEARRQQLAGQGMPSEVRETIAMGLELLATDIKFYPNGYFNTIHARLAAAKAAGITKPVSAHWFRHSHASHSIANGANVVTVQNQLGHASLATTTLYTHTDESSANYLAI